MYFELDLTDPYTISALTSCQLLPHGENLQDVLPRDIYRRLKRHLDYVKLMMPSWMTPDQRGKGLYADYLFNAIAGNWERKRPVWVMLMVNSLTEADIKTRGVPVLDLYLAQEAERMRKKTGAVEKVEEQCHPLNGLNFSQVSYELVALVAVNSNLHKCDVSYFNANPKTCHYICLGNMGNFWIIIDLFMFLHLLLRSTVRGGEGVGASRSFDWAKGSTGPTMHRHSQTYSQFRGCVHVCVWGGGLEVA